MLLASRWQNVIMISGCVKSPGNRESEFMKSVYAMMLALLAIAGSALTAGAQSYSIDWYKIAGGGGTSTGSVYSVSGTIGQPDAGPTMSGGNYSVDGGFWGFIAVVQT